MSSVQSSRLKSATPGGFFITGTDTNVGKTYIAGCIAKSLMQQGLQVIPRKPIASGCIPQADHTLLCEDALFLQQSCQTKDTLKTICPYQFEPTISPQAAIKQSGLDIRIVDLVTACHNSTTNFTLVEGAGGFYTPIALDGLNKDLAIKLDYPIVLVVANQLGCINQTLLTIAAIENSGLSLHSIIVNHVNQENTNHALGLADFTAYKVFKTIHAARKQPIIIDHWKL